MFKYLTICALSLGVALTSSLAAAQGRIAVVNLEEAILQTDEAQQRLSAMRAQDDYTANKKEFDKLDAEREELIKSLQKELAVMSPEQQTAARKRLANKNADLEHVLGKLQNAERELGQQLLRELGPVVQEVLGNLIQSEGIGLLLQRNSVIHADNGYDITAKLTDKLNQQAAGQ